MEILDSAQIYFDRILKDIQSAQHFIAIESYIFHWDGVGQTLVQELQNIVSQKKIPVYILLDGFGSYEFLQNQKPLLLESHNFLHWGVYHPLPKILSLQFLLPWSWLWNINKRNHRKLIIIDDEIYYLGSFNLTSEQLHWQEIGVRIEKPIPQLTQSFFQIWQKSKTTTTSTSPLRSPISKPLFPYPILLNNNLFLRKKRIQFFKKKILTSSHRVWILNAYFLPPHRVVHWLKKKAQQGLDIRIVIAEKSDVAVIRWMSDYFIQTLLPLNIKFYRYKEKILHGKALITDQGFFIGSSNMNNRSFLHDLELDVYATEVSALHQLEKSFESIFTSSQLATYHDYQPLSLLKRILGRVLLLLRYWF